jgi:hypothetical protein
MSHATAAKEPAKKDKASQYRKKYPGWTKVQGRNNRQRATSGANEVGPIHEVGFLPGSCQDHAHDSPCQKERKSHQKIGEQHFNPFIFLPDELKGIETCFLGKSEGGWERNSSGSREEKKPLIKTLFHPMETKEKKRPRSSEPKQRKADNHVGEMIPETYRKQPHEENFIGENGC